MRTKLHFSYLPCFQSVFLCLSHRAATPFRSTFRSSLCSIIQKFDKPISNLKPWDWIFTKADCRNTIDNDGLRLSVTLSVFPFSVISSSVASFLFVTSLLPNPCNRFRLAWSYCLKPYPPAGIARAYVPSIFPMFMRAYLQWDKLERARRLHEKAFWDKTCRSEKRASSQLRVTTRLDSSVEQSALADVALKCSVGFRIVFRKILLSVFCSSSNTQQQSLLHPHY